MQAGRLHHKGSHPGSELWDSRPQLFAAILRCATFCEADDFSDVPAESFAQSNGSDDGTYVDIDTFEATF